MKEFISLLIGNISVPMFAALFIFAMIGTAINLLLHVNSRDQNSPNTPVAFSFKFMLWDNWKRIVSSLLLIFVVIRFMGVFFEIDVKNQEFYLVGALLVGFVFDKLSEVLKQKTSFLKVRKD